MQSYYKITGRIRSEDNKTVEGYIVQAFDIMKDENRMCLPYMLRRVI